MDAEAFFLDMDAKGRQYGVRFGGQTLLSNSRKAMEGGEFAKAHGEYEKYHEALFKAFFTHGKDIGDIAVILEAGEGAGLDPVKLKESLDSGRYSPILEETTRRARDSMVNVAPTFLIEGGPTIIGAQSIDKFRAALKKGIN